MKTKLLIAPSLLISLLATTSFSEESCLSGKPDKGNLIAQLNSAKSHSKVTEIIYEQFKLNAQTQASGECITGDCNKSALLPSQDLNQVTSQIDEIPEAPNLLFKSNCLNESNEFNAGTAEVSCPDGTQSKARNLCLTQSIMTYQNAVISSFLACAKKSGIPTVSPSTLFEMYSLESGFKPQYAYQGGVGIGQLTPTFVADAQQEWRGKKYLTKIATSDLKECQAARVIAQKDRESKPNIANLCSFISLGDGMERNILYSLAGLATSWEKDLNPLLKNYMEKYKDHPLINEVKNLTTINAYGPGGRAAARTLANRLSIFPPDEYIRRIKTPLSFARDLSSDSTQPKRKISSINIYTIRMAKRQAQIGKRMSEPLKTEFANKGSKACINQ
jgi:hypothetical protein